MSPLAYIPPGVKIEELTSQSIAPLLAIPGSICLVGPANGAITRTDAVALVSTAVTPLPGLPTNATMTNQALVSVLDAVGTPTSYAAGTDFTFDPSAGTLTRIVTTNTLTGSTSANATTFTLSAGPTPSPGQVARLTSGTTSEVASVLSVSGQAVTLAAPGLANAYSSGSTTVSWGTIPDGHTVFVTYVYTPLDYFQPIRLNQMSDVEQRFGTAWTSDGTAVNSPLSFAASLAFQNGASNIVLQPLYTGISPASGSQPNTTQIAAPATWTTIYQNLLTLEDINIVVPIIGQSATNVTDNVEAQILEATQDFVYNAKIGNNVLMVALLGEDASGSNAFAEEAALINHAQVLASRYGGSVAQQTVLLNTAQFSVASATGTLLIGGQYVAAGIAGMLASQSPAQTVTRRPIAGIQSVTDYRSQSQKNNDASFGMMVIEPKGNLVQVRHGITLDTSSVATRELNVVRGKHYIIETIRTTLENQVIGKVVADADAPTTLNNVMIAALEDLRGLKVLSQYSGVQSRITSIDPTAMETQFTYLPIFTVNYITVTFSLDLTTQTVNVTTATA